MKLKDLKIKFFNAFVKITAYPFWILALRPKVYYEDKRIQGRTIYGPAIIISNHTSVYDYALIFFVMIGRTLRYQMAEVLFEKPVLGWFLSNLGGIYVNRKAINANFIRESEEILRNNGVVGIFPEARLAEKGEETPLPFVPSTAMIAMDSNVPIIPIYTKGGYFKKSAKMIIGKPIDVNDYIDPRLSRNKNIRKVSEDLRQEIIRLGDLLDEKCQS